MVGTIVLDAETRRVRRRMALGRSSYGATESIVNGVILGPLALVFSLLDFVRCYRALSRQCVVADTAPSTRRVSSPQLNVARHAPAFQASVPNGESPITWLGEPWGTELAPLAHAGREEGETGAAERVWVTGDSTDPWVTVEYRLD